MWLPIRKIALTVPVPHHSLYRKRRPTGKLSGKQLTNEATR